MSKSKYSEFGLSFRQYKISKFFLDLPIFITIWSKVLAK